VLDNRPTDPSNGDASAGPVNNRLKARLMIGICCSIAGLGVIAYLVFSNISRRMPTRAAIVGKWSYSESGGSNWELEFFTNGKARARYIWRTRDDGGEETYTFTYNQSESDRFQFESIDFRGHSGSRPRIATRFQVAGSSMSVLWEGLEAPVTYRKSSHISEYFIE
jgi:hypothetical protein